MSTPSQPPEHFEITDTFACYRPVADVTLDEAVDLIDLAILYCRENEISGLFADLRHLTGFPSPSVIDRFWIFTRWAETSRGKVVVSMVARPEMIVPDKIGVTVGANRGLLSDAFTDEAEALKWLRAACK